LIIIFFYDLKHLIIPDIVLFPAIITSLIYRILEVCFIAKNSFQLFYYFLAIIISSGFFLLLYLFSRGKWIGFGDVKLAVLLGLILGWPNILIGLFLSYLIGGIMGTGLIIFCKKKAKSEVPFAPFLITGTILTVFFGTRIIDWYLNLLL
jgi:leader peptidase (prepilin peptidase)/N-methyltransferase